MTTITAPTRIGQIAGAGDATALFLKLFSEEVITFRNAASVFAQRCIQRDIMEGKSAQFPVFGKAGDAALHVPGTEIDPAKILMGERVITIDGLNVGSAFVANIDEMMAHFQTRGEYALQVAESIAKSSDEHLARVLVNASRGAAILSGYAAGYQVTAADMNTSATAIETAILKVAEVFDTREIPSTNRTVAIRPAQWYLLLASTKIINRDWASGGSLSTGELPMLGGIELIRSNRIPSTNVTGHANTEYNGDFTKTVAIGWHRHAAGKLTLGGLATETQYSAFHQGTLLVAKEAVGHGILRTDSAIEIAIT